MFLHAWLMAAVLLLAGCAGDPEQREIRTLVETPVFPTEELRQAYVDSLEGVRYYKNEWLRSHSDSPLDPSEREAFGGVEFYPVDLDLVFHARFTAYEDPEVTPIATTADDEREAIRYGYFDFSVGGRPARLHGYKFTAHRGTELEGYIFVPFKDATTGDETYAGGRYLDLEEVRPGVVLVDFNDAYNPYCIFNERYTCPIPPEENRIDVAIRAGEKDLR
jgi:uncharacterized protein